VDPENVVVLYRILRVDYFYECPELLYNFNVVGADTKVGTHN
jgi:hypothetical protein